MSHYLFNENKKRNRVLSETGFFLFICNYIKCNLQTKKQNYDTN